MQTRSMTRAIKQQSNLHNNNLAETIHSLQNFTFCLHGVSNSNILSAMKTEAPPFKICFAYEQHKIRRSFFQHVNPITKIFSELPSFLTHLNNIDAASIHCYLATAPVKFKNSKFFYHQSRINPILDQKSFYMAVFIIPIYYLYQFSVNSNKSSNHYLGKYQNIQ